MGTPTPLSNATAESAATWRLGILRGLVISLGLWVAWFATHIPWAGISEPVALGIIGIAWFLAAIAGARLAPSTKWSVAAIAGLVAGVIGLLAVGSKLTEAPSASGTAGATRPDAALIVLGFLATSLVISLVAHAISRTERAITTQQANARIAGVMALTMVPLIAIGGLVTSTNSGMAVPDWPGTFGSMMFLYPIGPRSEPGVFLEHAHRLFGILAGMAIISATVSIVASNPRRFVMIWTFSILALVIAQGVLGGYRVRLGNADPESDQRWLALLHGVLGQLVFAAGCALAAYLSPAYTAPLSHEVTKTKAIKGMATGAFHAAILQLVFGAMYRHLRSGHALMSHIGMSIVVLALGLVAVAFALRPDKEAGPLARATRTWGIAVGTLVSLQFVLGWVAFLLGGKTLTPENAIQAVVRTAHQANGALLFGSMAILAVFARQLHRRATAASA